MDRLCKVVKMDLKLRTKCFKPYDEVAKCCSSKRTLTDSIIEKLVSLGCLKQLTTDMVIYNNCRIPKLKKNT